MVFKWFNSFRIRTGLGKEPIQKMAYRTQWAKDYQLVAWGSEALFAEYLEMGMFLNNAYFIHKLFYM